MKLTKMAGAFALTAALAMTAVPAFAVQTADNETLFSGSATNDSEATAKTEVEAELINAQLNASVPARVVIVIPSQSGEVTAPTGNAYKITNNSTTSTIRVARVSSAAGSLGLTTATSPTSNALKLTLDVGSAWTVNLDGSTANAANANVAKIAPEASLPLTLQGNVIVPGGTPLTNSAVSTALMTINYTIATATA